MKPRASAPNRAAARIPPCVRIAPFGRPVVPDVKRSAAGSSSSRSTISTWTLPSAGSGRSTNAGRDAASSRASTSGGASRTLSGTAIAPEAQDAEVGGDVVGRVGEPDRDAVARPTPARAARRPRRRHAGRARGTRSARPRTAAPVLDRRSGCWRAPSARRWSVARGHGAPQPPASRRLRRSHRYFFFVKAGPKSGLTWQFWILPTHIESSWRPWWFLGERKILPAGVTSPRSLVSSAVLIPSRWRFLFDRRLVRP